MPFPPWPVVAFAYGPIGQNSKMGPWPVAGLVFFPMPGGPLPRAAQLYDEKLVQRQHDGWHLSLQKPRKETPSHPLDGILTVGPWRFSRAEESL